MAPSRSYSGGSGNRLDSIAEEEQQVQLQPQWSATSAPPMAVPLKGIDSTVSTLKNTALQRTASASSTKDDDLAALELQIIHLRRTLRAFPRNIARLVQHLHVPDPLIPIYTSHPPFDPNPAYDTYLSLLASLVMACPNLRTFDGFIPFYNHTFDRLTHALSTRTKLEAHCWLIAENAEIDARAQHQVSGLMSPAQQAQFMRLHGSWSMSGSLRRLALCSPGGRGVLEHDGFVRVLRSFRALQELCMAGFDQDDFHDGTLVQAVPDTVSRLRLEELKGVTMNGLARWSAMPGKGAMEVLALVNMDLEVLKLGRILGGLERLRGLVVVQNEGEQQCTRDDSEVEGGVVMQPVIASASLEWIHWDVAPSRPSSRSSGRGRSRQSRATSGVTPNQNLALSIQHGGFPRLRRLRAPRDANPIGALQDVCAPRPESNGGPATRPSPTPVQKNEPVDVSPVSSGTARQSDVSQLSDANLTPTGLEQTQLHPPPRSPDRPAYATSRQPGSVPGRTPLRPLSTNADASNQRTTDSAGNQANRHSKDVVVSVRELELSDDDAPSVTEFPRQAQLNFRDHVPASSAPAATTVGNIGSRTSTHSTSSYNSMQSSRSNRSSASGRTMSSDQTDPRLLFEDADEQYELESRYVKGQDWDKEVVVAGGIPQSSGLVSRPIFWTGPNLDGSSRDPSSIRNKSGLVTWADFLRVSERRKIAAGHGIDPAADSGYYCQGAWSTEGTVAKKVFGPEDWGFEPQKDKTSNSKKRLSFSLKGNRKDDEKKETEELWKGWHVARQRGLGAGFGVEDLFRF
ncbi:uncharacterized protein AB675_2260 [Cyphellophora attinorum]|uniref:Uncharacterized protein n=1 Tax=Cyphellophora attinorum TaxID=1664694 RepID=A0A0N1H2V4_9EURO|nr:uncharacterized protein AB675_2260 [Phialophora attinorum]KPI34892.1 hypothetical protein AB675_2260 [Phialophora attinorum]